MTSFKEEGGFKPDDDGCGLGFSGASFGLFSSILGDSGTAVLISSPLEELSYTVTFLPTSDF